MNDTGTKSTFEEFVQWKATTSLQYLKDHQLWDPEIDGPICDEIEKLLLREVGEQKALNEPLQGVVDHAQEGACSNEWMGSMRAALGWYRLAQYVWRGGRQFRHADGDPPDIGFRQAAARPQLIAAVGADRMGNASRAQDLYTWSAYNRNLTQEERDYFLESNQPQIIWEYLPWPAYALACLGHWGESLELAEYNQRIIEGHTRAKTSESHRAPLKIHEVILALSRHMREPSSQNRSKAIEALHPQSVSSRVHSSHFYALFYLYNLRARHPELAHPDPDELPPAERARQGYEACLAWMAHVDLPLDGTPESLKLLDQQLREMWNALNEEKRKTALFLWGSYVGEVVRQELAGGQWNFEPDNMLAWTLDWELGEVELHLHPYQHVRERARGENEQGLYQLWREIEESYVDFGLAAKYAD